MLQIFHDKIFWTAKSERKSSSAVDELPMYSLFHCLAESTLRKSVEKIRERIRILTQFSIK